MSFFVAGAVKGTLGIGLPIAAVGLMTQFMDPRLAMSLMVFPIMITNIWQCYRAGGIPETFKKYYLFAIVLALSLITTTYFTARISAAWLVAFVGTIIVLFSLINLFYSPPSIPARLDKRAQFVGGTVAGIIGGLTAIWSPPIAIYLIARDVGKEDFVRATGFLFFIGSIPLCFGFIQNGLMTGSLAGISMAMIIPSLIGFSLGEVIRSKIKPERFKSIVLICFLIIGINLIRKALFV